MTQQDLPISVASPPKKWLIATVIWLAAWALVTQSALVSAMSVWYINDTYNHCFFILPGALYMIWQQRGAIMAQRSKMSLIGALMVLGLLIIFALGLAAYINVLQHIAIFAILPAMALMLFGFNVVRKVAFPLAFIVFSIPIGEELIPAFQDITAAISMFLLRLIDIPVYREGLYITIPGGHFVVAEACSGVRFFIACVVLASVFAYLNFISYWRMAAFGLFSLLLPIVANGIRAFGIIFIGYKTDMQQAVDADHLIYGWVFFSAVVIILILAGKRMSDGKRQWCDEIVTVNESWSHRWNLSFILLSFAPILLMFLMQSVTKNHGGAKNFLLEENRLRSITESFSRTYDWTPRFSHADDYRVSTGLSGQGKVYQAIYHRNIQNREMVSWENRIYDPKLWSLEKEFTEHFEEKTAIKVHDLRSVSGKKRLVAFWYVLPNRFSSNRNLIKLQQALNTLLLIPNGGAVVVVSLEYTGNVAPAKQKLRQLITSACQITEYAANTQAQNEGL
ncbi:MAG: exosortase [Cellvibrionaceae bacterium]|nr:exosortase [Cellvibrionaceae bacterium]